MDIGDIPRGGEGDEALIERFKTVQDLSGNRRDGAGGMEPLSGGPKRLQTQRQMIRI